MNDRLSEATLVQKNGQGWCGITHVSLFLYEVWSMDMIFDKYDSTFDLPFLETDRQNPNVKQCKSGEFDY